MFVLPKWRGSNFSIAGVRYRILWQLPGRCHTRMSCHTEDVLSIRLDPEIERRLSQLAKLTGRTKSYYARELIESNIEDLEDRYLAEARLEKRRPPLTSRQVRKELGLER